MKTKVARITLFVCGAFFALIGIVMLPTGVMGLLGEKHYNAKILSFKHNLSVFYA